MKNKQVNKYIFSGIWLDANRNRIKWSAKLRQHAIKHFGGSPIMISAKQAREHRNKMLLHNKS